MCRVHYTRHSDERTHGLYKEVLSIKKSMNNPLEKWAKDMNGCFIDTDKEAHIAKKKCRGVAMEEHS